MYRPAPFGSIVQDCSFAFRSLRHAPGFTLFTAVVIGLGVGAATTVFSVSKPLMLAPLPFERPNRLVWIARSDGPSLSSVTSRAGNLRDFRRFTKSFVGLTGYNAFSQQTAFTLTGSGEPTLYAPLGELIVALRRLFRPIAVLLAVDVPGMRGKNSAGWLPVWLPGGNPQGNTRNWAALRFRCGAC